MRCNQCGTENPDLSRFCQRCGTPLSAVQGMPAAGPKTSGLAMASFVMGLLCLTCVAWPFLVLPAIICGVIALILIANNKDRLRGIGLAITGIVIPVVMTALIPVFSILLAILMPALAKTKDIAQRVVCGTNFQGIGSAMMVYMDDYDGRFPTPEKWCDLLVEKADASPELFVCPSSDHAEGESSYAMNKNLASMTKAGNAAGLIVLFEADLGWNGVGGPEDVVFRHQAGVQPACNVLFADGHVELVTEDRLDELQWEP